MIKDKFPLIPIIESLGYKMQSSSWDRNTLERLTIFMQPLESLTTSLEFERIINEQDIWQIILYNNYKVEIVHAFKSDMKYGFIIPGEKMEEPKPMMNFERVFYGNIFNKKEFIKIMEQTECPFELIK